MKYSYKTVVTSNDLDLNNTASPSAVLRYMQEAAYRHLNVCPPTMDELRAEHKVFVLSRVSYSIYADLYAGDEIEVTSWPSESKGVSFPRSARITRNGSTVAELVSLWALIEPEKRTFWRSEDYNPPFEYEEPIELDMPRRFRIPQGVQLSLVGEYTARYCDVDVNRHINNTRYPDILCGFLPTMERKTICSVVISYLSEAHIGAEVKVYCSKEDDGVFYLRTVLPDGSVNVEAQIITDDRNV